MRVTRVLLASLAALVALPATAGAKIIEVGDAGSAAKPSCPAGPCYVISRTTGYQTRVGSKNDLFRVPSDGRIVAWTISLGEPRKRQIEFFEETRGGGAQAGITVLRAGTRRYRRVMARSPLVSLTPWFGETVQFPLATSLPVEKGNIIALTVPTWAPALAVGLPGSSSWRASRAEDACEDTQTQSAQTDLQDLVRYRCAYGTARLTYSATLVTTPTPPEEKKSAKKP